MAERPSTPRPSLLTLIWIGMPVVDITSRLVGSVKYVLHDTQAPPGLSDPLSADDDHSAAFARALTETEPQMSLELAGQLVRQGFLKVTGAGPMDNDLYVLAGQIATADDDVVRLSISLEELAVERERWI